MKNLINKISNITIKFREKTSWLKDLSLLVARLWIAKIFFYSGKTKIANMDSAIYLFENLYNVPLLPPVIAAYLATIAELTLPVLLVLGLFTPIAAFGLIIMTAVIELFVYPGTTDHYHWLIILFIIFSHGAGRISLDSFFRRGGHCS